MKWARLAAIIFLVIVALACVFAERLAPADYAHQFRDIPNAPASRAHLLGTDDLGRDRFSRVLYGTRISLLLAPVAALITCFLAAVVGGTAGFVGGGFERAVMSGTDLFLSLPWFFLLITARALMPLNVSPITSVIITFALLGCLGCAAAARSEEHTSELQSRGHLVCRLLLENKNSSPLIRMSSALQAAPFHISEHPVDTRLYRTLLAAALLAPPTREPLPLHRLLRTLSQIQR